jgi:hypothetical protein
MTDTGQNLAIVGARAVPWLVAGAIVLVPAAIIARRRWRSARATTKHQ